MSIGNVKSLPELFNLEFFASIISDINLHEVREALQKKTNLKEELSKMGKIGPSTKTTSL